ncbi:hypothetical protein [Hymenobacter elongatus]|uniref:T9SS type A sorting domain-containing protein n=1 Tax=Hymenobacter elongatus TaxID=877208 RepID=A0A4Z0PQP6_9BACT|nr:hypothetical protein [Hymenobacter elongatus]TGE18912.1 hypothetical protein E5J99_03995 [Hymenobacter elongatus]
MKQLLLVLCLFAFAHKARAQACNLNLTTQTQVDAIAQAGCVTIQNLSVYGGIRNVSIDGIYDLSPLAFITEVAGAVSLVMNDLPTIQGLANINTIGGGLYIQNATSLGSVGVGGFSSLRSIGQDLIIINNTSLTNIAGFAQLQSARSVTISQNSELGNVTGLNALSRTGALSITQCPKLRTITGLNNLVTVQGIPTVPPTQLPEPVVAISDNPSLEQLTGLTSLATAGNLTIGTNPALKELAGFNNLRSLTGLYIGGNTAMTTLSGFNGGLVLGGTGIVNINTNARLTSITGFRGLNVQSLSIHTNNGLKEIPGFASSKGLNVGVSGNPALESVAGFGNSQFTGTVQVDNNAQLQRITGFSSPTAPRFITVSGNPLLTSIASAFAYSSYAPLTTLRVEGNTALATCSVPWICSYLSRGELAYFSLNATGCNSNAAVQQGCQVLSTEKAAAQAPVAYPNPVSDLLYLRVASKFQISDLLGRVLLQGEGSAVSVAALPQGIYVVQTGPELKNSFRISKN